MNDKYEKNTGGNGIVSKLTGVSLNRLLVVFHCNEGRLVKPASSDLFFTSLDSSETAWAYLPCTGRVDMAAVLSCFRKSASGVLLVGCAPGACRFPGQNEGMCQAEDLVSRAKRVIDTAGLDPCRVAYSAGFSASTGSSKTGEGKENSNCVSDMLETLAAMKDGPLSLPWTGGDA